MSFLFLAPSERTGILPRTPNTWSQLFLHAVFSTKLRAEVITPELQKRLYDFLGGTIRKQGASLWEIGGIADHIHLLVRMESVHAPATLMRHIKGRSSLWARQQLGIKDFGWQEGGGLFSVSKSQVDKVKRYIQRQEAHHKKQSFKEEYLSLLEAHGVEYDLRYVFD